VTQAAAVLSCLIVRTPAFLVAFLFGVYHAKERHISSGNSLRPRESFADDSEGFTGG